MWGIQGDPVHPCAGREHANANRHTWLPPGSPLRGQGTPGKTAAPGPPGRFTPARAGNTARRSRSDRFEAVHPCAGREHPASERPSRARFGSPLRGQGTRLGALYVPVLFRFTPARAGNTTRRALRSSTVPVHPCAGREHSVPEHCFDLGSGSPLRGQGTPAPRIRRGRGRRFTPARAGNTPAWGNWSRSAWVHPCAGREHGGCARVGRVDYGSPLRGQGTPMGCANVSFSLRFTPARGQYFGLRHGSPLRGQGTQGSVLEGVARARFTPARAGNTHFRNH